MGADQSKQNSSNRGAAAPGYPQTGNTQPANAGTQPGNAGNAQPGNAGNTQQQKGPPTKTVPKTPSKLKEVQVTSMAGEAFTFPEAPAGRLTVGQVRALVGQAQSTPPECVKLIRQKVDPQIALLVDDDQWVEDILLPDDAAGVVELNCGKMLAKYFINAHKWEYVEVKFPGKEPEKFQGQGMAVRADIILWDDRWEKWDWKNGSALVNTSAKYPKFHSPGVTPGALEYAVKGCNKERPCEMIIVSEGWNNEDPDPEIHEGQLPVMDEAREMLRQAYPDVKLITMHGKYVAAEFNKQVKSGINVVLLMHATC